MAAFFYISDVSSVSSSGDIYDALDDVGLVAHASVESLLNVRELECVGHDLLDRNAAVSDSLDGHRIDVTIAEDTLDGKFLVHDLAVREFHFA